jgi:CMP-N,N'-diacetyllegionaminic acid synthase
MHLLLSSILGKSKTKRVANMYKGKRILGVIPARGGSKGLPGKNIAAVGRKPMIAWSINAAQDSRYLDHFLVSTDDEAIALVARRYGADVPFIRPAHLAEDVTAIEPVLFHAADNAPGIYDYIVLLQPTSPLRLGSDIDGCIEACIDTGAPAAISVVAQETPPEWMFRLKPDQTLKPILFDEFKIASRRQDLPEAWSVNGAVYVMKLDWYRQTNSCFTERTVAYPMPRERSICIDTPEDMLLARALVTHLNL